jgi:hypothetical protein
MELRLVDRYNNILLLKQIDFRSPFPHIIMSPFSRSIFLVQTTPEKGIKEMCSLLHCLGKLIVDILEIEFDNRVVEEFLIVKTTKILGVYRHFILDCVKGIFEQSMSTTDGEGVTVHFWLRRFDCGFLFVGGGDRVSLVLEGQVGYLPLRRNRIRRVVGLHEVFQDDGGLLVGGMSIRSFVGSMTQRRFVQYIRRLNVISRFRFLVKIFVLVGVDIILSLSFVVSYAEARRPRI